jgi:hypothetical protein
MTIGRLHESGQPEQKDDAEEAARRFQTEPCHRNSRESASLGLRLARAIIRSGCHDGNSKRRAKSKVRASLASNRRSIGRT